MTRRTSARERDEMTPQELYHWIEVCVRIIIEANHRLTAMKSRPVNIVMTPTDCEPWTSIRKKQRPAITQRTKGGRK